MRIAQIVIAWMFYPETKQMTLETVRENNPDMIIPWHAFPARVVPGHQVASGNNGNPRFPGGTLRMQTPHFLALGLDLGAYHVGTVNISVAPAHYRVLQPRLTFRAVAWHPTDPAEDFSFIDVRVVRDTAPLVEGLIYYPHPDTKPTHFQSPDVLELLLPYVQGLSYGEMLQLQVPADQLSVE